jgi:ribonuclease HI
VAEYEALVLGLRDAKDMGIEEISVFGDVELIFQQIKDIYQAKHPRLKSYKNEVWDLIDIFFSAFNISFIPREGRFFGCFSKQLLGMCYILCTSSSV